MARAPNNFYHSRSPIESIGGDLARAIFGDPQMAAKQEEARQQAALREAQAMQAREHARLYGSQADGQTTANDAQGGLPELFQQFSASMAPPPTVDSAAFADFDTPIPETPDRNSSAAALLAAMGQMQQDKVDPQALIATLLGAAGGDTDARRSLIVQGRTPGEEFAITSDRADEIAGIDNSAKYDLATDVATINNASDIPVAEIRAGATRDAAGIRAGASRDVAGIKAAGAPPGFEFISSALGVSQPNSGARTPEHNRRVGGVANSTHVPGNHPGVQGYDVPVDPNLSIEQRAAKIEAQSGGKVKVVEAKRHDAGSGLHDHFALAYTSGNGGKPGKAEKPPKRLTAADNKAIGGEINRQLGSGADVLTPAGRTLLLTRAADEFARTGNLAGAVQSAIKASRGFKRERTAATRGASGGQKLTVAQASKLPKGTVFVGMDGVERVKQ